MDFTEVSLWHYVLMAVLTVALVGVVTLGIIATNPSKGKKKKKK